MAAGNLTRLGDGGPDFGLRFTWSWSAGLEVLSPAGDGDHAKMCWKFLEEQGEGLFAVVMGVADVEQTRQHAVDLGYTPSHLLKLHGDLEEAHAMGGVPFDREKEWMRRVEDCTECVLEHWLGGSGDWEDRHRRAGPDRRSIAGGAGAGRCGRVVPLSFRWNHSQAGRVALRRDISTATPSPISAGSHLR